MEFFLLVTFILLALASATRFVADSRDGADWTPTVSGRRVPRRL